TRVFAGFDHVCSTDTSSTLKISRCTKSLIIWEKDDNILQSHPPLKNQNNQKTNSRFQFMYCNIENGNISVDIENLQNSDAGTYKCTIIIDGAYGQGTINLNVSGDSMLYNKM
uniref:Ig-like domain-containing protein n=1 Tax=Erpetoichthys calabaricus TaxID=27687 RepID=A0A8C4T379_ERPCA